MPTDGIVVHIGDRDPNVISTMKYSCSVDLILLSRPAALSDDRRPIVVPSLDYIT